MKRRQITMPAGMAWPPAVTVGLYRMQQERLAAHHGGSVVIAFPTRRAPQTAPEPPNAA